MKTLIGGAVAATLGLLFMIIFLDSFMDLIQGIVPALLLAGGGLALYLGFDELKDSWKNDEGVDAPAPQEETNTKIEEPEKE